MIKLHEIYLGRLNFIQQQKSNGLRADMIYGIPSRLKLHWNKKPSLPPLPHITSYIYISIKVLGILT